MAKPKPTVSTEIIPYIFYRDVPAALGWLTHAFGFAETMPDGYAEWRHAWRDDARWPAHHDGSGQQGMANGERSRG
jgi:uncharacterized glyoxalase superfamily protein PhnB